MKWLKKLLNFGKKPQPSTLEIGNLRLVPSGLRRDRAEAAMPGTKDIAKILYLVPPPVDPELVLDPNGEDPNRDYPPTPVADVVARYTSEKTFNCKDIEAILYNGFHTTALQPTYHVITPNGQTTYLTSSDAPPVGQTLLAAWPVADKPDLSFDTVTKAAQAIADRLAQGGQGFTLHLPTAEAVQKAQELNANIMALAPEHIEIIAYPAKENENFDGRETWKLLHSLGLKWGDMDCFQWADPTYQTDYLIWVEADDGEIGYVLPEDIATGRQNFRVIRFSINPLRIPAPDHVLTELLRMTEVFQQQTGCKISCAIDGKPVDNPIEIRTAIQTLMADLNRLGIKAGGDAICVVR